LNTLFDVKQTVRSLIGDDDPNGWLKDAYLLPKINYVYRRQTLYIKRSTGMNLEQMVEIPNAFDANTNPTSQGLTSLAVYQQKGGPLFGMYEPLTVWWKPAGSSARFYREARPRKTILPGLAVPGAYSGSSGFFGGGMEFTWRGNQLFVTPVHNQIDMLVDGRFNAPPLVKDQDILVVDPDMEVATTTGVIPCIGVEAGNPSWTQVMEEAEACCDDIVAKLVRQKQDVTARAGTNGRRGGRGVGWGWY
jgi:hypothetical protein